MVRKTVGMSIIVLGTYFLLYIFFSIILQDNFDLIDDQKVFRAGRYTAITEDYTETYVFDGDKYNEVERTLEEVIEEDFGGRHYERIEGTYEVREY